MEISKRLKTDNGPFGEIVWIRIDIPLISFDFLPLKFDEFGFYEIHGDGFISHFNPINIREAYF